jgi:acyl-CoA thioester hydrolase
MSAPVQTYRGTVMQWHCDHMGHMNVMWYVGKFDEATWNLFAMFGITAAYLRDTGHAMAAVDQRLQYRSELLAGDTVVVHSGVLEAKAKVFRFFHEMKNAATGEVAATCRLVAVHMDAAARKAAPFPGTIIERAQEFRRDYDFGDRD